MWPSLVQHCICEIHIAAPSDSLLFHWYMVCHCMNLLQLKFYSIHSTVEIFTTINNSMRTLLCVIFIVVKHTYFPFYSFLNIKSSGIKYIHNIVQLSPQFISRTFSYLFDAHMWIFLMGIYLGNAGSHCICSTLKNIARLPWWLSLSFVFFFLQLEVFIPDLSSCTWPHSANGQESFSGSAMLWTRAILQTAGFKSNSSPH